MQYEIYTQPNGKIALIFDQKNLSEVLKKLAQLNQEPNDQIFARRLAPFFLGKFMHWANRVGNTKVHAYMLKVRRSKTSHQGKFELGDLKNLYRPQPNKERQLVQEAWMDFLSGPAQDCICNRKVKEENKQKYLCGIVDLRMETSKPNPYNNFIVARQYTQCEDQQLQSESTYDY